jgi:ABC-type lipoprotein release transport system permease subunit
MNPIHAGPRMNLLALVVCVSVLAGFIVLTAAEAGWGVLGVFLFAEILLFCAFSRLVAKRRRDVALLRCFGASRGQVFAGVLGEAAFVGVLAAVAGAGVSYLVFDLHVVFVVVALIVGAGSAVLAALVPAYRASRVPPTGPEGWRPLTSG